MYGGRNPDGTAWLSPKGARHLAEVYTGNKWTDFSQVQEEFDQRTYALFEREMTRLAEVEQSDKQAGGSGIY